MLPCITAQPLPWLLAQASTLAIQQCPLVSHLPTSSTKESSTTASSTALMSSLGRAWLLASSMSHTQGSTSERRQMSRRLNS